MPVLLNLYDCSRSVAVEISTVDPTTAGHETNQLGIDRPDFAWPGLLEAANAPAQEAAFLEIHSAEASPPEANANSVVVCGSRVTDSPLHESQPLVAATSIGDSNGELKLFQQLLKIEAPFREKWIQDAVAMMPVKSWELI